MTIEEKARAYDEAIKRAKDSFNYPSYPGFIRADVVFPELKKDIENENIRNEIINYFKCLSREEPTRKDIHNKWITWLESLKLYTYWKPTEEQIKALCDLNLTGSVSSPEQGLLLIELYKELKKL